MTRNEELKIKLDRIRNLMKKEKLDAVYLKRQDDFAWLTCGGQSYLGWGEMGNCGLLVLIDRMYAITNMIEYNRMLEEEHLENMGFEVLADVWFENGFEIGRASCRERV